MAGRPRLPIGTFGAIATREVGAGRFRAVTLFRDWDGASRQVIATGPSRSAAVTALKQRLLERQRVGDASGSLSAASPFGDLADAWMDDVLRDADRSDSTKDVYARAVRSLILPVFEHYTVREVTVGRVERFLRDQRAMSYARAKQSRAMLSMIMGFAVRRELISINPVTQTSPLHKPKHVPRALTEEQVRMIRAAARDWRAGEGVCGPRPDGQVRDLIEVMLGTGVRIGEALALRAGDVDLDAYPSTVTVNGTIVALSGRGVARQPTPKTNESHRTIAIPTFVADVLRARLDRMGREDDQALLFSTRHGRPLAPNNVRRTFRQILKSVGLDGIDITPHAFRRTAATLLARDIDLNVAAEVLGHASTRTTKAHYAEPAPHANEAAAQALERLGSSGSDGSLGLEGHFTRPSSIHSGWSPAQVG